MEADMVGVARLLRENQMRDDVLGAPLEQVR